MMRLMRLCAMAAAVLLTAMDGRATAAAPAMTLSGTADFTDVLSNGRVPVNLTIGDVGSAGMSSWTVKGSATAGALARIRSPVALWPWGIRRYLASITSLRAPPETRRSP